MRAGLLVMILLYCALSAGFAPLQGYPSAGVAALAVVAAVLALMSIKLLSARAGQWWRSWPALAVWQTLAALTVLISTTQPATVGQRLPSDYLMSAASAVTASRASVPGHLGMLALLGGSATGHARVSGADRAISVLLAQLFFYGLMVAVFRIIHVSAARTDQTIARLAQVERVALVALTVRRDRMRRMRVLHDTVLATLAAVAQGLVTDGERARARFAADLERINRPDLLSALAADWRGGVDCATVADALDRVAADAEALGLTVHLRHAGPPGGLLGTPAAEALVGGVAEALANARRHAGVPAAEVSVQWHEHRVVGRVRDGGRGFDRAGVRRGIGLRESLGERVVAAGGTVHVDTAPGAGTLVEIAVPVSAPDVEPAEVG